MRTLWLTCNSMMMEASVHALDHLTNNHVYVYPIVEGYVDKFYEECEKVNPDIVFFTGPGNGPLVADPKKLKAIKEKWPLINFCTDGACRGWWDMLNIYKDEGSFTATICTDGGKTYPRGTVDFITLALIAPKYFTPKKYEERTHDFGFMGAMDAKREKIVAELGTQVVVNRARCEVWGSYQDYADFICDCRAILNFSENGSHTGHHIKYRVVESALAEAALLEQEGSELTKFVPWRDFYSWADKEDIEFFLQFASHRFKEMGEAMHKTIKSKYSPERFLEKVLTLL